MSDSEKPVAHFGREALVAIHSPLDLDPEAKANANFWAAKEAEIKRQAPKDARYVIIHEADAHHYYLNFEDAAAEWRLLPSALLYTLESPVWGKAKAEVWELAAPRPGRIPNPTIKTHLPKNLLSAIYSSRELVFRHAHDLADLLDLVGWPDSDCRANYDLVSDMDEPTANALDFARETVRLSWVAMGLVETLKQSLGDRSEFADPRLDS